HEKLLADCPNSLLLSTLKPLKQRVYRYGYVFLGDESVGVQSVTEHRTITNALVADDIEAACAALKENWRSGPERYLPLLDSAKKSFVTSS
ncbi:MAG: hypothetical protein DMF69_21855, partial [Acidobacteria bacterium]